MRACAAGLLYCCWFLPVVVVNVRLADWIAGGWVGEPWRAGRVVGAWVGYVDTREIIAINTNIIRLKGFCGRTLGGHLVSGAAAMLFVEKH